VTDLSDYKKIGVVLRIGAGVCLEHYIFINLRPDEP